MQGNVVYDNRKTPGSIFSKEVEEELRRNRTSSTGMLGSLQGKQVYQGTVSTKTKKARRTQNRIAKASRRANRGK